MDNLRCVIGSLGARDGHFVHDGRVYSPLVSGRRCGDGDSDYSGKKPGLMKIDTTTKKGRLYGWNERKTANE